MADKSQRREPSSIQRARRLRSDSTFPERLLWGKLRGQRLAGLKFRRQHPLGSYILDFYCYEAQLAIELDGDSHEGQYQHDIDRQRWIELQGVRVLRFGNDDVLHDMDAVLTAILRACGIAIDGTRPQPALSRRESGKTGTALATSDYPTACHGK